VTDQPILLKQATLIIAKFLGLHSFEATLIKIFENEFSGVSLHSKYDNHYQKAVQDILQVKAGNLDL
jgi:hypothetical protein